MIVGKDFKKSGKGEEGWKIERKKKEYENQRMDK